MSKGVLSVCMVVAGGAGSFALGARAATDRVVLTNAKGEELRLVFGDDGGLVMSSTAWRGGEIRFGPGAGGMHGVTVERAGSVVQVGAFGDDSDASAGVRARQGERCAARLVASEPAAFMEVRHPQGGVSGLLAMEDGLGLRVDQGVPARQRFASGWFGDLGALGVIMTTVTSGGARLRGGLVCDSGRDEAQVYLERVSNDGDEAVSELEWGARVSAESVGTAVRSPGSEVTLISEDGGAAMVVLSEGVEACLVGASPAGVGRLRLQNRAGERGATFDVESDGRILIDVGSRKTPELRLRMDAEGALEIEREDR
ncbi:MAG: hypothetical protein CMJ47_02075 [Planctomyces sp.]|nr:hypothetical protein [Planctomyces sp.]